MNFHFCRIDSVMLVEEKFDVTSVDASDKMLKYALKTRWARRKEPLFDNWGKAYICYFMETVFRNCTPDLLGNFGIL